ncbi:hypothetical protein [Azospirillum soli]|uniref:hypothetical protein n=1 Tax=Azospirillum soli TaxID=1304799 RepID=UPI001FE5E99A|nr:hypothetical protein [Azospirillum soli]MBP2314354.1 hypothetical protein [Azospirillum soli]
MANDRFVVRHQRFVGSAVREVNSAVGVGRAEQAVVCDRSGLRGIDGIGLHIRAVSCNEDGAVVCKRPASVGLNAKTSREVVGIDSSSTVGDAAGVGDANDALACIQGGVSIGGQHLVRSRRATDQRDTQRNRRRSHNWKARSRQDSFPNGGGCGRVCRHKNCHQK